jgi:hypothetical protein
VKCSGGVSATPFFGSLVLPERAFQSVLDLAIESLPLGNRILPNLGTISATKIESIEGEKKDRYQDQKK